VAGSQYCYLHGPEFAEARREAAKRGGHNRSAKARAAKAMPDAMSADDLAGWLSRLFLQTHAGQVEPKVAHACAALARVLLEAQTAAAQPRIEELQDQVEALRVLIERQHRGVA
jgi:hypothetical protein